MLMMPASVLLVRPGYGHFFWLCWGCGAVLGIAGTSVCRLLFRSGVVAVQMGWVGRMPGCSCFFVHVGRVHFCHVYA